MNDIYIPENLAKPEWRLRNLYYIKDKNANIILFNPNNIQQQINKDKKRKKLILKARQFGVTTNEVLKRFDSCIFGRNRNICILAHKREVLETIFDIVRIAYKYLPEKLKPTLDRGGGSKYEYRFPEINSRIYVSLEVRGGTVHELHVSEAAFIPEVRLTATLQAVPKLGLITLETTPNGLNHFYDKWTTYHGKAWAKLFFPWYLHNEYKLKAKKEPFNIEEKQLNKYVKKKYNKRLTLTQINWRRDKIAEFRGKLKFLQEYPENDQDCFLASGSNPFDADILSQKIKELPTLYTYKNQIKIYKPVDKKKTYVIGADPAEGVRSDYSAASVYCVEDKETVAIFKEWSKPTEFADILYEIGKLYYTPSRRYPLLIVERNNHGHAVLLKLIETHNYPNLWHDSDDKPGHRTTTITRPLLIDGFIDAIESHYVKINFKEIFDECLTLIDNNGKIEAEEGKRDDLVIANALAIKVLNEYAHKISLYKDLNKKILV